MCSTKRSDDEAPISGGLLWRCASGENFGMPGAQFPLAPRRDRLILRPLPNRPAVYAKKPRQFSVGFQCEGGFCLPLCNVHEAQSRTLDFPLSSDLVAFDTTLSPWPP